MRILRSAGLMARCGELIPVASKAEMDRVVAEGLLRAANVTDRRLSMIASARRRRFRGK